jgi:6-pyruvoyltetrahydropterin/6-carboxytetrahydropterin synthase
MYHIKKRFNAFPFAHRQWTHDGHCAFVHGHNWNFIVELKSETLDDNGFVYDFGKFKTFKVWLADMFDHTCLINSNDPELERMESLAADNLIDLRIVTSCSCEGLAEMIYDHLEHTVEDDGSRYGAKLVSVTVEEDYKNSATYKPE